MSSHADLRNKIRRWPDRSYRDETLAALDALLAENQRLRDALRISYPMTPVDCFISELRDEFVCVQDGTVTRETFERHVEMLREALAGDAE